DSIPPPKGSARFFPGFFPYEAASCFTFNYLKSLKTIFCNLKNSYIISTDYIQLTTRPRQGGVPGGLSECRTGWRIRRPPRAACSTSCSRQWTGAKASQWNRPAATAPHKG